MWKPEHRRLFPFIERIYGGSPCDMLAERDCAGAGRTALVSGGGREPGPAPCQIP
jgi:hypothetical protein